MKMFGTSGNKNNGSHRQERDSRRQQPQEYYYDDADQDYAVNEYGESEEQINQAIYSYRKKRRRRGRTAVIVILALVVVLVGVYYFWVRAPKTNDEGLAQRGEPTTPSAEVDANDPNSSSAAAAPETPEPTVDYTDDGTGRKKYCYTFMVLGQDKESYKTDTIIVGMMDVKNHTISCVSLPRDTLTNVSWGTKKINSVYYGTDGVGDIDRLLARIKDVFGFSIDQYAVVNLQAFVELVDAVGGIYYNVPIDMKYYDVAQNLDINIDAGYQLLDGQQSLNVVRFRQNNVEGYNPVAYPMGDIDRIATQQDFLKTAAKQMLTLGNIPNLTAAVDIFDKYVDTSLSSGNIAWYAKEFLKMSSESINFMTLPGNYSLLINGTSYVEIKSDEWLPMLNQYFNPYYEEITEANLDLLHYDAATGALVSSAGEVAGGPYSCK